MVPLVGWLIATGLEDRRQKPRNLFIARQIAARRHPTIALWGDDPRRRAVASRLCKAIQLALGWPNSHYLPDDRLDLLMWEICQAVAEGSDDVAGSKRLGVVGEIKYPPDMTLGQLVDVLLRERQRCPHCGYDLRASPERCPECGNPSPASRA